jgi:CheY-like chemotaxis protein
MERIGLLAHPPRDDHPRPGALASTPPPSHPDPSDAGQGIPPGIMPAVLVVDDEAFIVDFLAILLEDEGFRVLRAYDGEQAWRLAQAEHPSLIISDVMMPRMTGLELLERLRSSGDGLARLPVILMSAVARGTPRADAAFIPKPFDIERMLSLVSRELAAVA